MPIAESVGSNALRPLVPLVEVWAVAALHAIVSHKAYCQELLECDLISVHTILDGVHIQEVLSALEPCAQLTFGACLACLATRHWDLAAQQAAMLVRLMPENTLIMICSRIQEAVLVGFLFIHLVSSLPNAFLFVLCGMHFCKCCVVDGPVQVKGLELSVCAVGFPQAGFCSCILR